MKVNLTEMETFYVCGFLTETTLEENHNDVKALYDDFFLAGKEELLKNLKDRKRGYYGLTWYTQGRQYCYLLGIRVEEGNNAPEGAVLKKIPKTTYAVARFPKGADIIRAWTEFFYDEIPKAGLQVDEQHNIYYEYYPESVYGDFELWVPVVKIPLSAE